MRYTTMKQNRKLFFSSLLIVALIMAAFLFSGCAQIILSKERLLNVQGKYSEVEAYLEPQAKSNLAIETSKLFYLCTAYGKLKRYDKVFSCLDRLQERIDAGENIPDFEGNKYIYPRIIRAEAYIDLRKYDKAIEQCKLAYDYIVQNPPSFFNLTDWWKVEVLPPYGLAFALGGYKEDAERITKLLEDLLVPSGDANFADKKGDGLAKIYVALGRYQKALAAAAASKRSTGGDMFMSVANLAAGYRVMKQNRYWLGKSFILYKSLLEVGKIEEAKAGFDELLGISEVKDNGEIYWQILFDRGRIALMEGDHESGIVHFKKAVEIIEQQRSTINTEASKIGFVGDKQAVYSSLVDELVKADRVEEAFSYVERGKARALVDLLASKRSFKGGNRQNAEQLASILGDIEEKEISTLTQSQNISSEELSRRRGIVAQRKSEIIQADQEFASLVAVTPLDVTQLQQLLPPDETLLEYFGAKDTLYAFIVSHNSIHAVKLNADGLHGEVQELREHILNPPADARGIRIKKTKPSATETGHVPSECQSIYKMIFKPLEGALGRNLTIVPHGVLHYVPFNALFGNDAYLIDRYNIRVLPSASVMQFLEDRKAGRLGNLLVLGNPDLGDPKYDLPGAEEESKTIAGMVSGAKLLTRNLATETAVKSIGGQFRFVHFACHGTFNADEPLTSGLLLAGDNRNDGKLTVEELYDINLPADLITLSACETALGKVSNGDDVVGFTRGFLYAGANSIVSSLWQVDDIATSKLMQQFYSNLKSMEKRSALRAAQRNVKSTYNPHPFYWAAFQITGSTQ